MSYNLAQDGMHENHHRMLLETFATECRELTRRIQADAKDHLRDLLAQETRNLGKHVTADLQDEISSLVAECAGQQSQMENMGQIKELLISILSELCGIDGPFMGYPTGMAHPGSWLTPTNSRCGSRSKYLGLGEANQMRASSAGVRASSAGGAYPIQMREAWGVPVAPRSATADSLRRKRIQHTPVEVDNSLCWNPEPSVELLAGSQIEESLAHGPEKTSPIVRFEVEDDMESDTGPEMIHAPEVREAGFRYSRGVTSDVAQKIRRSMGRPSARSRASTRSSVDSVDIDDLRDVRPPSYKVTKDNNDRRTIRRGMTGMKYLPRMSESQSKSWCARTLRAVVMSEYFDYVMGVFLMLNALSLGVTVDYWAGQDPADGEETPIPYRVMDLCFCVIFTAELASRLLVFGCKLYTMDGWQWGVFDTVIVIFQILDEFTQLFLQGSGLQEIIEKAFLLRLIKLGRIARLVRMVRLIPELKSMVYLIFASMWSFFWTLVLLVLMMYCFAIFFTESATEVVKKNGLDHTSTEDIRNNWGSIMKSILSLYQAITGGDDWCQFIKVFEGEGSMYIITTLVFALYIAFATLVMLNLVTGVFVDAAQRIAKEDKDNELVKQVCKMFVLADEDESHEISWPEFKKHLSDPGMDAYFKTLDLTREEAGDLFHLLDVDQSGYLTVEEFVRGCMRLRGPARSVDLAAFVYDFNCRNAEINVLLAKFGKKMKKCAEAAKDAKDGNYQLREKVESLANSVQSLMKKAESEPAGGQQRGPVRRAEVEGILV